MNRLTGVSIDAARREIAARFKSAGLESPELDARLLIGDVLKLDHTQLSIRGAQIVARAEADAIERHVLRRLAREPVARILGYKEFWGLNLQVSYATLIPRPDTETVVTAALEFLLDPKKVSRETRIADIGTGSGAILLALLSECKSALGVGTDISADALSIASVNAANLDLAERATFVKSNYAEALSGPFDLVVSNPPYIRSAEIGKLGIDVRDYDPHLALDGGADGLDAYRILAPQAAHLLVSDGALIVEIGHDQAAEVGTILGAAGLAVREPPRADLGGKQRVVIGLKPAN